MRNAKQRYPAPIELRQALLVLPAENMVLRIADRELSLVFGNELHQPFRSEQNPLLPTFWGPFSIIGEGAAR
jgi:hypothetical protein